MADPFKTHPGRPLGSRGRRTIEFLERLEAAGFCPATALMDIYKIAMEKFIVECEKEESGRISPMESNAAKYLKIAADNASDLASYAYPKQKAIEQKRISATDGMTPQEKLEAAKSIVCVLEQQVKNGSGAT